MRDAVGRIEQEIGNLRSIITELRPAALDELGLRTALESLIDRHREQSGLSIDAELSISGRGEGEAALDESLQMAAYRLAQEALTNAAKHAPGAHVSVTVTELDGELVIEVADDGTGFDTRALSPGFGLAGMRERVSLAGGTMEIDSGAQGTRRRLLEVPFDVVFQFPSFATTPAELLTLRVGDSLGLGHPKGRPLEVRAEGLLVALAEICSSGVHKACEITEEVTR